MGAKKYFTIEEKKLALRANYKRWRDSHIEEARKRSRDWALANPDKISASWKSWSLRNGFEGTMNTPEFSRAYYLKNKDRILDRMKNYRNNNPDKIKFFRKSYKARKRAGGSISKKDIQFLYEENIRVNSTLTCGLCDLHISFGDDSLDHKIPLSRGGNNSLGNLWIVHKICNLRKSSKTVEEFLKLKGD